MPLHPWPTLPTFASRVSWQGSLSTLSFHSQSLKDLVGGMREWVHSHSFIPSLLSLHWLVGSAAKEVSLPALSFYSQSSFGRWNERAGTGTWLLCCPWPTLPAFTSGVSEQGSLPTLSFHSQGLKDNKMLFLMSIIDLYNTPITHMLLFKIK